MGKKKALAQAHALGEKDGATDFNAKGYVGVVDVVDQCPAVGAWLDTLTHDQHAFNEAHAETWQAYSQGYTKALKK